MAPNPVVTDCAKIAVEQSLGDAHLVNTFYCRTGSPASAPSLVAMASAMHTAWAEIIGDLSTTWHINQVVVTDLSVVGGAQYIDGTVDTGTAADNPIPYQAAADVSWRTARVGRSFRGRSYIGGFTEAGSAGGSPTAGVSNNLADWANGLKALLDTIGELVIVSRFSGMDAVTKRPIPRVTNIATPVTSAIVRPGWATQRRRTVVS